METDRELLMTRSEVHGWRRAVAAAALFSALVAAACTRSVEPNAGSGESHFLASCDAAGCGPELSCLDAVCSARCESTRECESLAENATCEAASDGAGDDGARLCDVRCGSDEDCSSLGETAFACSDGRCRPSPSASDAGQPEPTCPAGCVAVYGYPLAPERGCVDRAGLAFLGCDCSMIPTTGACVRRTSDDTLWALGGGQLDGAAGFAACTIEEYDRVTHACEFASCELPPLSLCTVEATCADRGCDNLQYDAQGCRRTPCETDADCAADDRCVGIACTDTTLCWPFADGSVETCGCGGPAPCIAGASCNPVTTVGPRGAWRTLALVDSNLICMAGCMGECPECTGTRTVDASGSMQIRPMGTTEVRTAMLSEEDRATLALIIDGPTLRAGLRDGLGCEQPGADSSTGLRLELPDVTLVQDITGCSFATQESEVGQLAAMLYGY